MHKNNKLYNECYINDKCNSLANQYLILVTIFASLLSQEIEDDEDLGILGTFLVALGEELALASEMRIACKSKFKEEAESKLSEIEDIFVRSPKKVKKKRIRKYMSKSNNNCPN